MLINYFLFLVALLAFAGLALDTGLMQWRALRLQQAADAAAQEAMYEYARNDSNWSAAGLSLAAQNGFTNGVNGVTVTVASPPSAGLYAGDTSAIQATVSQSYSALLMRFLAPGAFTVSSSATAKVISTCVWIMNATGSTSTTGDYGTFHLASTTLNASTCGVFVNTTSAGYNLGVDYFSTLISARTRVVGPSSMNLSTGTVSPQAKFGAATKNDPLAYVTAPTFSACNHTNATYSFNGYTINPGTYCGGLTINTATVDMNPGLYIITGNLSISAGSVFGSGITFYMTKGGGSGYGTVQITNSSFFSVSAPTTSSGGALAGIVFFEDRGYVNHNAQSISFDNSTVKTDGIWYALNTGISSTSTSFRSAGSYLGVVIDNFYSYLGATTFLANYSSLGEVSPYHYDDGVLVQ